MSKVRVLSVDPERPDAAVIGVAAEAIRAGKLVGFPTETVYGLGANALDRDAVEGIFVAKGRPADDPLIVHLADAREVDKVAAGRPPWLDRLAGRFWPGPLTLVLPRGERVPTNVTAGRDTVALRVPAHPVARSLIAAAGVPIAAPSANLFARPSPTSAEHVILDLGDRIDLLLDGGSTLVGVESTVLDLTCARPRVLRPGGVTAEALRAVIGKELETGPVAAGDPRSPGTAERHYSPRARMDVFDVLGPTGADIVGEHLRLLLRGGRRVGALVWDEDLAAIPESERLVVERLGPSATPDVAARRLYAALRALDARAVEIIVARMPPPVGLGVALRDRLRRAASGRVLTQTDATPA